MVGSQRDLWRLQAVLLLTAMVCLLTVFAVFAIASYFHGEQVQTMTDYYTELISVDAKGDKQIDEAAVRARAHEVARDVEEYLRSQSMLEHPDAERLMRDERFKKIGYQRVGEFPPSGAAGVDPQGLTGYTAVYMDGKMLVHFQSQLVGQDITKLRKTPEGQFMSWWKIYSAPFSGHEASGYYLWREEGDRQVVK